MIAKVSFTFPKIRRSIQDQSILMLDITGFESKQLYLEKVHTIENLSNMLTKCLPTEKLEACWQRVGLVEPMT